MSLFDKNPYEMESCSLARMKMKRREASKGLGESTKNIVSI